jgi:hypothetical protein
MQDVIWVQKGVFNANGINNNSNNNDNNNNNNNNFKEKYYINKKKSKVKDLKKLIGDKIERSPDEFVLYLFIYLFNQ